MLSAGWTASVALALTTFAGFTKADVDPITGVDMTPGKFPPGHHDGYSHSDKPHADANEHSDLPHENVPHADSPHVNWGHQIRLI